MLKLPFTGFDWDEGNRDKNFYKHKVLWTESEEIFFNKPLLVVQDLIHSSEGEKRYLALGKSNEGRKLFIAFTQRGSLIRVISAHDMSAKERIQYEKREKE